MTYVSISALAVPDGAAAEIEQRFAARRKGVDTADGFVSFELLRPALGESRYFVITRWESQATYQAWADARPKGNHEDDKRRGMTVEVFGFESVPLDS